MIFNGAKKKKLLLLGNALIGYLLFLQTQLFWVFFFFFNHEHHLDSKTLLTQHYALVSNTKRGIFFFFFFFPSRDNILQSSATACHIVNEAHLDERVRVWLRRTEAQVVFACSQKSLFFANRGVPIQSRLSVPSLCTRDAQVIMVGP